MARPSVIPGIKARLEAWLDQRESDYMSQPEEQREVGWKKWSPTDRVI